MASYNVLQNIDDFLDQLTRLIGAGYIFYFEVELQNGKNPEKTQERIIDTWGLNIPYWKREKRRRGNRPSIWLLRYNRTIVVLSTYGRTEDGAAHPFFVENEHRLKNIRKTALYFGGYSVRYPISKETGRRKLFIRLDRDAYLNLKTRLCRDAIKERFRSREAMEAEFRLLPWQPYGPVYKQLRTIHVEVNKRRKHKGFEPLRLGCIPMKRRPPSRLSRTDDSSDQESEAA